MCTGTGVPGAAAVHANVVGAAIVPRDTHRFTNDLSTIGLRTKAQVNAQTCPAAIRDARSCAGLTCWRLGGTEDVPIALAGIHCGLVVAGNKVSSATSGCRLRYLIALTSRPVGAVKSVLGDATVKL